MNQKKMFIIFLLTLIPLNLLSTEVPLASKNLIKALVQEVSGEIAFKYTSFISNFDRIQASQGWRESALWIKQELEKIGYRNSVIEGWPSNGSTYYYTYKTPIGWKAENAELWIVSPETERLCSYEEVPLTLVKHSNSADVEAELVDVGSGIGEKSYLGKDVEGKIVLATEYTGNVMREAVLERGALGVITWYPPHVRPGYPNMIRYTAIWPSWEERTKIGFAFNVSKSQGWKLKRMLEEGKKVVLRAKVEAEYYNNKVEVLTVTIPGKIDKEKEILIIGHLCHPLPSANDNASGSGGMLEMARALKKMIDAELIDPPLRTIRFLWVPEFAGTYPYIKAHLERTKNTLAVINCDMIGEDMHLTGGTFNITRTPDSISSFLNDVVVNFAHLASQLNLKSINGTNHPFIFRVLPFSGGSDHYVFNDGALKVPAVMFGHGDTFHHTSLDTIDKVDPSELRRVCFITLGASYYLANVMDVEAKNMARLISRNGLSRLAADYYDALDSLFSKQNAKELHETFKHILNILDHSSRREVKSVLSVKKFIKSSVLLMELDSITAPIIAQGNFLREDAFRVYQELCESIGTKPIRKFELTSEEKRMDRIIPKREDFFVCPLQTDYVAQKLGKDPFENITLSGYSAYEALNYTDGSLSLLEIAKAVTAEYGRQDLKDFYNYFVVLEQAGLIKLGKR